MNEIEDQLNVATTKLTEKTNAKSINWVQVSTSLPPGKHVLMLMQKLCRKLQQLNQKLQHSRIPNTGKLLKLRRYRQIYLA